MYHADSFQEKLKLFLVILWPIMVTQISMFSMNIVDTMMSGRAGTEDLAGVAIGGSLWLPIFTGMNGILLSTSTIIAHLMGSDNGHRVHHSAMQAIYLAVLLTIGVIGGGFFVLEPVISFMNLESGVHDVSYHYLIGLAFGILPLFLFTVLRYFFDGQGFTRITMYILFMTLPVNFFFNYALIFGHFGFPQLGGVGAGYATAITFWFMFIAGVMMTFRVDKVRRYKLFVKWVKPSWTSFKEQLSIGIPMGLSLFFEASIFAVVTLLIGVMFTTVTVAANQVVLNFTSLLFMIPLSISMALTIVVGYSVGGKRLQSAKDYSWIGVLGGTGFLMVGSVFLFLFREQIAYLYTDNPDVVAIAMVLFIVAIIFQISDALQSSLQGVLRGYKDVTLPFYIAFVSYWMIGLPAGFMLALTDLGPIGFWIGITLGLTSAAIGFYIRLRIVLRRYSNQF
ncbi:MATE family efflux transporter [Salisediminibacterium beveridgei]|uniref:Probable multidrug resistance protein NorM n=1 Tax=Salisediminibacterium beveridgei TaxID=632773 RepID=A0A1D7QWJ7_9BACI|nr:MATE family efflux transporter [Salisediminibacterium beveridgei]AOM83348.1 Multi antimicrobial extrusion protein (Na(+)/drug antiporter), MATE family of MDR efflux pumps [Salisediminibacterium beveridgei]